MQQNEALCAKPQQQPPIAQALDALAKAEEELKKCVSDLENRLAGICPPPADEGTSTQADERPLRSAVTQTIEGRAEGIRRSCAQIREILSRCEL